MQESNEGQTGSNINAPDKTQQVFPATPEGRQSGFEWAMRWMDDLAIKHGENFVRAQARVQVDDVKYSIFNVPGDAIMVQVSYEGFYEIQFKDEEERNG